MSKQVNILLLDWKHFILKKKNVEQQKRVYMCNLKNNIYIFSSFQKDKNSHSIIIKDVNNYCTKPKLQ